MRTISGILRAAHIQCLLLSVLIIPGSVLAAPSYDPITAPEFQKRSLLNGMEVLLLRGGYSRQPFILMVQNGAAFDPIEKWGVTELLCRLMLEGSDLLTGPQIQEDLRAYDAELTVQVEWDAIYFQGSAPPHRIESVLELLAEIVIRPRLGEEEFGRIRDHLIQEVREEAVRPETRTEEILLSELFRGNPYEHTVKGTPETLANIDLIDVKLQYRRLFLPNQSRLALFTSGDQDALFGSISRRWGSWVRDRAAPFTFRPADPPEGRRIILLSNEQERGLFRWARVSVEKPSRDFYGLKIFEQYLTLKLPQWASEVSTSGQIQALARLEARKLPGYVQLSIQAPNEQVVHYMRRFLALLESLVQGETDAELLEEARRMAFSEFSQSFETPSLRLRRILEIELYNLGLNYIPNYGLRLQRVGPEEFRRIVSTYLDPSRFVLVVAGPVSEFREALAEFGSYEILN